MQAFTSKPSVVSWFSSFTIQQGAVDAGSTQTGSSPALLPQANGAKARKRKHVEVSVDASVIEGGRGKRDRKQTDFYDVVEVDHGTPKQAIEQMEANERDTGLGSSGWKAVLLSPTPQPDGSKAPPYLLQMQPRESQYYVGCPVLLASRSTSKAGFISGLTLDGKEAKVQFDDATSELVNLVGKGKPQVFEQVCGDVEPGRHVQVKFDNGLWYVGLVATVKEGKKGSTELKVIFEDGDEVPSKLPDPTVNLMPREWSELIASKGKWGWFGWNKDRAKSLASEPSRNESGRKRKAETQHTQAPNLQSPRAKPSTPKSSTLKSGSSAVPDASKRLKNSLQERTPDPFGRGGDIPCFQLLMHGNDTGFFVGCPVKVNTGKGTLQAGIVATVPAKGKVVVLLKSGAEATLPCEALVFDEEAAGSYEVGKHAQLLFDGLWFVGVVTGVTGPSGKEKVTLSFEDGEQCTVSRPTTEMMLIPKEWSDKVSSAGVWGWWGYNKDRAKSISQSQKPAAPKLLSPKTNAPKAAKKPETSAPKPELSSPAVHKPPSVPKPSKKLTLAALQVGIDKPRPDGLRPLCDFLPDSPKTPRAVTKPTTPRHQIPDSPGRTTGRERKAQDYSKMAAGNIPKDEEDVRDEPAQLSPLALAITLCDSLHAAAFDDSFEAPTRMVWKTKIANPSNSWLEFGMYVKEFESKLEDSAFFPQYEEARDSFLFELGSLRDEEEARQSLNFLAGQLRDLLFKSEQQRLLCCGAFHKPAMKF